MQDTVSAINPAERIRTALSRGGIEQAVAHYYEICQMLPANPMLEWRLAQCLSGASGLTDFPARWPAAVVSRISGAAVVFAGAQAAGVDIGLPDALAAGRPVPVKHRRCIARSWHNRPECECLSDIRIRRPFVEMLARDAASVGDCLLAEASRSDTDPDLLDHLCRRWLAGGIYSDAALDILTQSIHFPKLTSVAKTAVVRAIQNETGNRSNLLTLLELAYSFKDFKTVARHAPRLINQRLTEDMEKRLLIIYLASLSETGENVKAAELYRARWRPAGRAYPYPEKLLYGFQRLNDKDLEHHLLKTAVFDEKTPEWVRLYRNTELDEETESGLRAWAGLYSRQKRDERVLVGFTKALLRYPEFEGGKWRAELIRRWERLCAYDTYRGAAFACLVLLHPANDEKIRIFEKNPCNEDIHSLFGEQAVDAYMKALCKRKRWKDVRAFLNRGESRRIMKNRPINDITFIRLMADLETIPEDKKSFGLWGRKWEQLIGLPLDTESLMEAADHFIRLNRMRAMKAGAYENNDYFEDLKLQFLRRIKAEAESILIRTGLTEREIETYRSRLMTASFEGTYRILTELSPFLQVFRN